MLQNKAVLFQDETSGAEILLRMSPECRFRSEKQDYDAKITIWHGFCNMTDMFGDGAGREQKGLVE